MKFTYRSITPALAAVAILSLPACSTPHLVNNKPSLLPIETNAGTRGGISNIRAYETYGRLYVTGHLQNPRGSHIATSAHVDVVLVGRNDQVLAERRDNIEPVHPMASRARTGYIPFSAGFPLDQARQAKMIRVSYELKAHGI